MRNLDTNLDSLNVSTSAAIAEGAQTTNPMSVSLSILGSRKKPRWWKDPEADTGPEEEEELVPWKEISEYGNLHSRESTSLLQQENHLR